MGFIRIIHVQKLSLGIKREAQQARQAAITPTSAELWLLLPMMLSDEMSISIPAMGLLLFQSNGSSWKNVRLLNCRISSWSSKVFFKKEHSEAVLSRCVAERLFSKFHWTRNELID